MNKLLKAASIIAALTVAGAVFGADSAIGTWKLNLSKSTFSPGPPPKEQTRTYSESAGGISLLIQSTAADGKKTSTSVTYKGDGSPAPISGNPNFDTVAVKRVDDYTVNSTQMKNGKTVGTGVRTVSKDGKTLTYKQEYTDANGTKMHNTEVYDRQ